MCAPCAEPSPFSDPLGWLCHTKRTFNPSLIIRKRRHGFLGRCAAGVAGRALPWLAWQRWQG
jgi:ribosomal protein L34